MSTVWHHGGIRERGLAPSRRSGRLGRRAVEAFAAASILGVAVVLATPAAVAHATGTSVCIAANGRLNPGDFLFTLGQQSGVAYKLIMQTDGNLAAFEFTPTDQKWHEVWDTQTGGNRGAYAVVQGSDGNFVVRSSTKAPLWSAGVPTSPNDRVCLQPDGNIVARSTSNAAVWATMTNITASYGRTSNVNDFDKFQCTWYADNQFHAWTTVERYGTHRYVGWHGNAGVWDTAAKADGWTVGTIPRAGSIVVFDPGVLGADPDVGHVAWVTQVYPTRGTVRITEMNWPEGSQVPHTRTIPATHAGLHYIYVNPS